MDEFTYEIGVENAGERIDKFLSGELSELSRSYIQKLLKEGMVTLGGKALKANYRLREKDEIEIKIPPAMEPDILPENIPLDILYEDSDVLVVNKPKGMVVHPGAGHYSGTLVNALLYHCGDSLSGINGVMRPGIVHRIDRDTTGSLLVCKNDLAHRSIAEQLKVHSITRKYRAIVYGNLKEDEGTIDAPIGRHPADRKKMAVLAENAAGAKYAYTGWQVLERCGNFTYIACKLKTGRTHQIRVHMASTGHPLAGDAVYGPKNCIKSLNGQCLHAKELGFVHPRTGEWMQFDSPLPPYFTEFLTRLRKEHRA